MGAPEVTIKGDPGDKAIEEFLADVKTRYHRAFRYLGSRRVEYLPTQPATAFQARLCSLPTDNFIATRAIHGWTKRVTLLHKNTGKEAR